MANVMELMNEAVSLARLNQGWYLDLWHRLAVKLADGDEPTMLDVRRLGELDVLLRELGRDLAEVWRRGDEEEFPKYVPTSTTMYSLSVAWVFAAYEMTRTKKAKMGESCPASLREVHRRLNLVRIPLAKGEAAGTNRKTGGPVAHRGEGRVEIEAGSYAWRVLDPKAGGEVDIVREHLSVELLRMLEEDWSAETRPA